MLNPKATIALMICCRLSTFELQAQSMPIQNRVESLIDSWEGRPTARESLLKVGSEPEVLKALGAIAASSRQPFMRRHHAIGVLATFKSDQSVGLLCLYWWVSSMIIPCACNFSSAIRHPLQMCMSPMKLYAH